MAVTTFLANNLAYLSEKSGVALSTVARDLGMSPSSLLRLAREEAKARLSTIMKVAAYFHVDHIALGAVDLTAPGALDAATRAPEAMTMAMSLDDEGPAAPNPLGARPVVAAHVREERQVPVLTCQQALDLNGTAERHAAATDWLPPLPWGLFSGGSLFAVKAPSATMAPSIRQGDYLYLRNATAALPDPVATVLAEVGAGEGCVFSLGTVVAKSSEELLLVGQNPITGTEPRHVRKVVGVVVAVLSIR